MAVTQRHFVLADLDGDVAQGLFQFFIDFAGRTRGRFRQIDVGGIENRVQWLCGAIDDEFILSGAGVVAVKARPEGTFGMTPIYRQMVRPDQIGDRRYSTLPARSAVSAVRASNILPSPLSPGASCCQMKSVSRSNVPGGKLGGAQSRTDTGGPGGGRV